jgi:hypothetical protein
MGKIFRPLIIIVAAAMLLPCVPALAQTGPGTQSRRLVQPLPPRTSGSVGVHRGRRAWENGRWHHTARNGRLGWWWDVGGVWYYYPGPVEGPPSYVSDIEVPDETASPSPPSSSQPSNNPRQTFYYPPGSLTGTSYPTVTECWQARDHAGVGICVMK